MTRFVVLDKQEHMPPPSWGIYRRVAVVETDLPAPKKPKMITTRAVGCIRIVKEWRRLYGGKTKNSAYIQALGEALLLAEQLNDEAIDTSDIPEADEEWFKKAKLQRKRFHG